MLSFTELAQRPGDEAFITYGLNSNRARSEHTVRFLDDEKLREMDAMFMVDLDMTFPGDALERLRAHDADIVGGHYYMRQIFPDPMFSIVRDLGDGVWPYAFMRDIPRKGLHEVAMMGMGCVLIKRKVLEAVRDVLPPNSVPVDERPMPHHAAGSHHVWGADFAFYTLARDIGYKVLLDASIRCGHMMDIELNDDLYDILAPYNDLSKYFRNHWHQTKEVFGVTAPKTVQVRIDELVEQANQIVKEGQTIQAQIKQLQENRGQLRKEHEAALAIIGELKRWQGGEGKPQITDVANLPRVSPEDVEKFENRLEKPFSPEQIEEARQKREEVYAGEALEHIDAIDAKRRVEDEGSAASTS